jgi:hypothetical protein
MSAEIFKYQLKVRTALYRYRCIRQATERCGGQCAQGPLDLTEPTKTNKQTNKQTNDIPTNYTTILLLLWIASFIPVFTTAPLLSQINPANFHPRFTAAPSHRLYKRLFSSGHGRCVDSQVCSLNNLSLDNALHLYDFICERKWRKFVQKEKMCGKLGRWSRCACTVLLQSGGVQPAGRTPRCLTSHTDRLCRPDSKVLDRGITEAGAIVAISSVYCMSGEDRRGLELTTQCHLLTQLSMRGVTSLLYRHAQRQFHLYVLPGNPAVAYRYTELLRFRCHMTLLHY